MRTTLTVDDDLAERIADIARESRTPFKRVLNDALRRVLELWAPKNQDSSCGLMQVTYYRVSTTGG
jgi:predicted transcriptional regulator